MKIWTPVTLATVLASAMAHAAPTTRESAPNNPDPNIAVFRDSQNPEKIWVGPPKLGRLEVVAESLTVDPSTCEQVTVISDTRLAKLEEIRANQKSITSIELVILSLVESLQKPGADVLAIGQQVTQWQAIQVPLLQRRTQLENETVDTPVPDYLVQSGGYYTFNASVDWATATQQVQNANPEFDVSRLLIGDGRVAVNSLNADGFRPTELIINVEAQSLQEMVDSPDGMDIQVHMTKIGACFLRFPEIMQTDAEPQAFGMIMSYTYPQAVTTLVTAEYNLRDVYHYLSSKGSDGGLFSSSTWSSVSEDRQVDSVMNIAVNTSGENLTPEQQDAERRYAREILLSMATSEMTAKAVPPGAPGATGAAQAAQALQNACGFNAYCQGVSVGLTVLNGIFGSAQSRTELNKILNDTRTYSSEATDTITMAGSISFVVGN